MIQFGDYRSAQPNQIPASCFAVVQRMPEHRLLHPQIGNLLLIAIELCLLLPDSGIADGQSTAGDQHQ